MDKDFIYLNRIKRLQKIYNEGESLINEWKSILKELGSSKKGSLPIDYVKLNTIADKIEVTRDIMIEAKEEIKRIELEISN